MSSAPISDPQIRRRIVAASGFTELGLYQEAVEELEGIPETVRTHALVLGAWLEVYQSWQKWHEAIVVAERLSEEFPGSEEWPVALAYATRRAYGLPAAFAILVNAVQKFPGSATIHFNLACYHAQLGHLDISRQFLQQAISLDERFEQAAASDPDLEPLRGL